MREIKVRAWDKEEKAMILHDELNNRNGIMDFLHEYINPYAEMIKEFEGSRIYMQYTGLKDKNGTEIYEGDEYHLGDPNITYTVVWRDTGLIGKQDGSSSYAGLSHWRDRIEVIGNIYENPELLKEE